MIDSYLNGPRTLSNKRLSYLVIGHTQYESPGLPTPASTPRELDAPDEKRSENPITIDGELCDFNFMICAAHFLGDGMALHNFANDFFTLLGSSQSLSQLEDILQEEWSCRWVSDEKTVSS